MADRIELLRACLKKVALGLVSCLMLGAIGLYRALISPIIVANSGPACRFEPTCSVFAREAVVEYGPWRGGLMAIRRVLRCRPAGGWGYDPVRH